MLENYLEYKNQILPSLYLEGIFGGSLQGERTNFARQEGAGFISDDLENNAIQAARNVSIPLTNYPAPMILR